MDLTSTAAGSAQRRAQAGDLTGSAPRGRRANRLVGSETARELLTGTAWGVTTRSALAPTLWVGQSQKSGQVLVRTYVLKYVDFPKLFGGMSGVLKLCICQDQQPGSMDRCSCIVKLPEGFDHCNVWNLPFPPSRFGAIHP